MKSTLLTCLLVTAISLSAQDPVIRITENQMDRDFKILYSAQEVYKVDIRLLSSTKDELMKESFNQKAFMKAYSLDKLKEGKYYWSISYDGNTYEEEFRIKSMKQLMKESISVNMTDLNLDINVKDYNTKPMNIFLFDFSGDQIDYVFWEPTDSRSKKIDLSRYDAYEIKLEIVQGGDLAFQEEFRLY